MSTRTGILLFTAGLLAGGAIVELYERPNFNACRAEATEFLRQYGKCTKDLLDYGMESGKCKMDLDICSDSRKVCERLLRDETKKNEGRR